MTRVKRGVIANKRRKKILKAAKGFRWGQKSKERLARQALLHALPNAFIGRKQKKRNFRRLWQTKVGAASRSNGVSYSQLIHLLKTKNVILDRKILAQLAEHHPETFERVVTSVR
ncbi:MAG: 50S ribosomal protein L20 [Candidatus Sungbacteria bacterium]|nr:50S ribosomal protein L20 [Candidatus Sungbacteria bacterium]